MSDFDIGLVVDRIEDQSSEFITVGRGFTTKPLEEFAANLPGAYAYIESISSPPGALMTGHTQAQIVRVGVLIVCPIASLEVARQDLNLALAGWEPIPICDPMEHESSKVVETQGNVIWWSESFSFRQWR